MPEYTNLNLVSNLDTVPGGTSEQEPVSNNHLFQESFDTQYNWNKNSTEPINDNLFGEVIANYNIAFDGKRNEIVGEIAKENEVRVALSDLFPAIVKTFGSGDVDLEWDPEFETVTVNVSVNTEPEDTIANKKYFRENYLLKILKKTDKVFFQVTNNEL